MARSKTLLIFKVIRQRSRCNRTLYANNSNIIIVDTLDRQFFDECLPNLGQS